MTFGTIILIVLGIQTLGNFTYAVLRRKHRRPPAVGWFGRALDISFFQAVALGSLAWMVWWIGQQGTVVVLGSLGGR